jgi:hypothetical protein|tara:strand:+ start:667 stop:1152 length:486 start_codon:yes stop_codon:yes gene_type:complete
MKKVGTKMKITKRQLTRIIREERSRLSSKKDFGPNSARKNQLRRIIRESCGLGQEDHVAELPEMLPAAAEAPTDTVPVPEDYNMVRDTLEQNPEIVDLGISAVMDMVGTGCERSTAQGIIDHLQDMVAIESGAAVELVNKDVMPPLPSSSMEMIKGPGFGG